jgi:hypothetical protein
MFIFGLVAVSSVAVIGARAGQQLNPFARFALQPGERFSLVGTVEESLKAGSYTYLRVKPSIGEPVWVVTLTGKPRIGAIRLSVVARAETFSSRRLARDFSPLLFAAVETNAAQP